mmetsp:Transcript_61260/g.70205  ORF Transcript_61260/g.70205 Transcript_61260/m.70205 type:complete len:290 (-) Transcript_61260:157-1026(-)
MFVLCPLPIGIVSDILALKVDSQYLSIPTIHHPKIKLDRTCSSPLRNIESTSDSLVSSCVDNTEGEITIASLSGEIVSRLVNIISNFPVSVEFTFCVCGRGQGHIVRDASPIVEIEAFHAFNATINTLAITGSATVIAVRHPHLDVADTHRLVKGILVSIGVHPEVQSLGRQILLNEIVFRMFFVNPSSTVLVGITGMILGERENLVIIDLSSNSLIVPTIKQPHTNLEHVGVDRSFKLVRCRDVIYTSTGSISSKNGFIFTEITDETFPRVTVNLVVASPILVVFVVE